MTVQASSAIIETASRETLPLPVTGLLLCGGKSRRMGSPKSLLPFENSTFVEHRLQSLRQLFPEVLIVANSPDEYDAFGAAVVKDIIPDRGPLVGILSGLLVSRHEYCFVVACDMPLVDNKLIRRLCAVRRENDADAVVVRHEQEMEPLLAVYSRRVIERLEDYIFSGQSRVQDFLATINCAYFDLPSHGDGLPVYFNVNTPTDYARVIE